MKNQINKVVEFNEAFGTHIPDKVTIDDSNREKLFLYTNLLQEELNEIIEALKNGDKKEVLDGFADLQVVLFGGVGIFGAKEIFKTAFNRVHRSNMSKFCKTLEEAEQTKEDYESKGVSCSIQKTGNLYSVIRYDGKLLKSINWKIAKLDDLV